MARSYLTKDRGGVWYYRLRGEKTYHTTGISVRYNRDGNPTQRSRDEAVQFAAEEWERRGGLETRRVTLQEFLEPYYDFDRCPHIQRVLDDRGRYSRRTADDQRSRMKRYVWVRSVARRALPVAGAVVPDDVLTAGDLEDWKRELKTAKVGARTRNKTLADLKTALNEGVHRGELLYNPAQTVRPVRENTEAHGYFTKDELLRIFAGPRSWRYRRKVEKEDQRALLLTPHFWYSFALAVFALGQRPQTLRGLRWRHLNHDELTIPGELAKTDRPLVVPVPRQLLAAFDELRDNSVRIGPDDWILGYDDGRPLGETSFRNPFERMMAVLKLPERDPDGNKRVPYSLKVSLITHLSDDGLPPQLIADYVGHARGQGEAATVLTPVQRVYKRRQASVLHDRIVPAVEAMIP